MQPEPAEGVPPSKPKSRWKQSQAVAPKPIPLKKSPEEITRQLAADLRARGDQMLGSFVAGPLVVLDLDAGTLTVECGAAAATLASQWGLELTDPARPAPYCRGSSSFTCSQFSQQDILILELADPDNWTVVSAIVGNYRTGRATLTQKMGQMRSMISTATCP